MISFSAGKNMFWTNKNWEKLVEQIGGINWWKHCYSPSHSTNHVMPFHEHLLTRQQSLSIDRSLLIIVRSHFVKFSASVTFMTQANTISRISAIWNRKMDFTTQCWSYSTTVYLVKMESGSEITVFGKKWCWKVVSRGESSQRFKSKLLILIQKKIKILWAHLDLSSVNLKREFWCLQLCQKG